VLSIAETPATPPLPSVSVPAPVISQEVAPASAVSPVAPSPAETIEVHDASPSVAPAPVPQPMENASWHTVVPAGLETMHKPRRHSSNALARYWREVGSSFRRDARAFYVDCAETVRGIRGKSNRHAAKPQIREI